jgi:hypothetical protein
MSNTQALPGKGPVSFVQPYEAPNLIYVPTNPANWQTAPTNIAEALDELAGSTSSEAQFEPARTLFVSSEWPAGSDPAVFFTTISDAITQAATLSPIAGDPISIAIDAGTYNENVTLQSFINLSALSPAFTGVTIDGTLTWMPTGAVAEAINVYHIVVGDAVTIDTTGKAGGHASVVFQNCEVGGTATCRSASGGTQDFISFENCTAQPAPLWTFSNCAVEWLGGRVAPFTFNGACTFTIDGATTVPAASGTWSVNNTTVGKFIGTNLLALGTTLSGTASVAFTGCFGTGAITVPAGATADVRGSNNTTNLVGPGKINRTISSFVFGPTSIVSSVNPVAFTIPYIDANYSVALQLTASAPQGPGNVATFTTALANTGFTINDSVGGNTYQVTVSHP